MITSGFMSGDEVFVLIVSCIIAAIAWGIWLRDSLLFRSFAPLAGKRGNCSLAPLLCAAILFAILKEWAAHDVRDSIPYLVFYLALGAAWVGLAQRVFALGGVNARDDVFERRNPAAAHSYRGCLVGLTLCFAGGNIGDGPGWWVVVFSALLATATFLVLWLILDRLTGVVDSITIDRDRSSGIRAAGYFIGTGLVLGRAVAGNWTSAIDTVQDFGRNGWPAGLLMLCALIFELALKPSPLRRDDFTLIRGWLPAIILVSLGVLAVVLIGGWQ